ncbi:hypothetical protein [Nocardia sp. NPDC023988]|uniref:hypothetical protein n=1 Tax=unclassified Nocardia TaxID=2637762 RepID=UPI003404D658
MKRSFAVATVVGALILAPIGSAQAATQPVAPVAACVEFPIGAPGGCDFIQNILQLLSLGSSTLSAGPTAS